jgi:hypothetical protein
MQKLLFMQSPGYAKVCLVVAAVGWATKGKCRRPKIPFPTEVKAEMRRCFDAVPRMNAYEIHVRLRDRFKLGPKVLRVGQISGWISNEVGRRKQAAEAATHSAANAIESANAIGQAGADQGVMIASKFSEYLAAIHQQDFTSDVLPAWKQTWRRQKSDPSKQLHELALMSWEDKGGTKRKRLQSNAQKKNPHKKSKKTDEGQTEGQIAGQTEEDRQKPPEQTEREARCGRLVGWRCRSRKGKA